MWINRLVIGKAIILGAIERSQMLSIAFEQLTESKTEQWHNPLVLRHRRMVEEEGHEIVNDA